MIKKKKGNPISKRGNNLLAWGTLDWKGLARQDYGSKAFDVLNANQQAEAVENYQNTKNAFGISKKNNLFSKGNIQQNKDLYGAAAGMGFDFVDKTLSGGKSSGAGTALVNAGAQLFKISPLVGGIVATVGTGVNILKGNNAQDLARYDDSINSLNNVVVNSASTENIMSAVSNIASPAQINRKSFGLLNGKTYQGYVDRVNRADAFAQNSVKNAAQNQREDMRDLMEANYAALGGGLNIMSSLDGPNALSFANSYLDRVLASKQNDNSDSMKDITDPFGLNKHAFGGNIGINGANFPTGLTHVDAGGTHEENPNEGVPMGADANGTPNLVEEGETIYDDYVFSDRLEVPEIEKKDEYTYEEKVLKKYSGLTYSEAAKKAEKETGVDERPNDAIAKRGFTAILEVLAQSQEQTRQEKTMAEVEEKLAQLSPEEQQIVLQQLMVAQQPQEEPQMQQEAPTTEEEAMQMQQMQPQEQMIEEQMAVPQEEMMQQPMMRCGGHLKAEGGQLIETPEQLEENVEDTAQVANENIEEEATPEQPVEEFEDPMQSERKMAEDMSTKELNSAIEEIIQWAKDNKDRQVLREAKKLKKSGSREDKEEFVDEMMEEMDEARREEQSLAEEPQPSASMEQQIAQQPEAMVNPMQMAAEQPMAENPTAEAMANDELAAQGNAFADGGSMGNGNMSLHSDRHIYDGRPEVEELLRSLQSLGLSPTYAAQALSEIESLNDFRNGLNDNASTVEDLIKYLNSEEGKRISDADLLKGLQAYINDNEKVTSKYQKDRLRRLKQAYANKRLSTKDEAVNKLFEEDLKRYYDIADPTDLSSLNINRLANRGTTAERLQAASNLGTVRDWENRGARAIPQQGDTLSYELPDGRVAYQDVTKPFERGNNSVDDLVGMMSDLNDNYRKYGIYNVAAHSGNTGFDIDKWSLENSPVLHQWKLAEDGKNAILGEVGPNATSKVGGVTAGNYKIADFDGISPASKSYRDIMKNLVEGNDDYRQFTQTVADALDAAGGEYNNLPEWTKAYLQYLDNNSNGDENLLQKNPDGTYRFSTAEEFARGNTKKYKDVTDAYVSRRNDQKNGIYHSNPMRINVPPSISGKRLWRRSGDGYQQVFAPNDFDWEKANRLDADFTANHNLGEGFNLEDYVIGDDLNRDVVLGPDGQVYDISSMTPEDRAKFGIKTGGTVAKQDTPYDDGYNRKTNWFSYDPRASQGGLEIPTVSDYPFRVGLGLQGAALAWNALRPVDYSNADGVINAARNSGRYMPIKFKPIGNYLEYDPLDRNYEGNKIQQNMAANRRALADQAGGNRGFAAANLLASDNNLIGKLGEIDRQAAESNRAQRQTVEGFNRDTNKYNSEGFLQEASRNQDAYSRAAQASLSGVTQGYAMRQAAEDAKANAISAGITGISNLLYNKYAQDLAKAQFEFTMKTQPRGLMPTKEVGAEGGKIRRRRKKGLTI